MVVKLLPTLEKYLNEQIRQGRFRDISDAVNHAIVLLQMHDVWAEDLIAGADIDELRRAVQQGIDELERGECVDMGGELFRQIRERGMKRVAEERKKRS